jgi:uncharacterized protein YifE (UPF0438 family)
VTNLICLEAFREASRDLEKAHLKYRQAALDLARIHANLERALDHAYREQSFGRLDPLFTREEVALALYEQAAAKLTKAEERWCALRVALAYERELMQERQPSHKQLN